MDVMLEIIKDWLRGIIYTIQSNLRVYARILEMLSPYIMYAIGQIVFEERGQFHIGGEVFIPIMFYMIVHFMRAYANKIGKGTTIPIPSKRFTEVDDNDEVSIENNRVQELLLYVADLEDWMERKGLLK